MSREEVLSILPELIVSFGGLLLLFSPRRLSGRLLGLTSLAILVFAFDVALYYFFRQPTPLFAFSGMVTLDRLAFFLKLILLTAMAFTVLAIMGYAKEELRGRREIYALVLLVTAAALLLVGAQHLALVYVGLEMLSLLSYLLTGSLKKEPRSIEGALKYFLFGSLATGTMLYGISLFYGLAGTLEIPLWGARFPQLWQQAPVLSFLSLFLLVVGVGFKVALVPFHMWAPDAYEGAPTPVTAFLSVGPKVAGLALLARILVLGLSPGAGGWMWLLGLLSILTMTVGNMVAVVQTNVKRLLAYSSIAQAGYMAIGIAVGTSLGLTATLYYLIAYLLMNLGVFLGVIAVENATGREDLQGFSGLSRREPVMSFMITICLLSLAGIPPMAGFFAKFWIFSAALSAHAVGLAVVAAINSVIALFYYLKIVKCMYLDPATGSPLRIPHSRTLRLGLVLCTVALLVVGLAPERWLLMAGASIPLIQ